MQSSLPVCVLLLVMVQLCGGAFFRTDVLLEKELLHQPHLAPKQLWYTQKLDHFNEHELKTWEQRYFVNEAYWNSGSPGPIFFQLGGENMLSGAEVTHFQMFNYGKAHGALLVALEHRFYGLSQPFQHTTTENLAFLSSQQALADAADFILWLKRQYNATDSPIITFGCSYPGNLAAWFRLKYPNITLASVASSAPVQATPDFFQYLEAVDKSLTYVSGRQCEKNIRKATDAIQSMLQHSAGQMKLQKLFATCTVPRNEEDITTFMNNMMLYWMTTVQYNDEGGNPINIRYLCNRLNEATNPLFGYANISNMFLHALQQPCLDIRYSTKVAMLNDTTPSVVNILRPYVYQMCREFGFFQTTDSKAQPFGDRVPFSYYRHICEDAYGIPHFIPDTNATNAYYGGKNITAKGATNILFVNGNIDPWHVLSITENQSPSVKAIMVDGVAHCADVLPSLPQDPRSLKAARKKVARQIAQWLKNAPQRK